MLCRELLLESHPDEMTMYHGTYGGLAKRIAQKGLIARPQQRHYEANDPDEYHLASLNGTYFTNTLSVAVGYAYKASIAMEGAYGWCAVIVARVPLIKAVPDEDIVGMAMKEAERQTRDPDAFARAFHRNLVQDRPIPIQPDLLTKVRDAYAKLDRIESDAQLVRYVRQYRRIMDQVTRAYAQMVFDTHPKYLGGNHTMRLPQGLPRQNIVSITEFQIDFPQEDDGGDYGPDYPHVREVKALLGQPFTQDMLQDAVDDLQQRDFF